MMTKIAYYRGNFNYPEDVERLAQVAYRKGYSISLRDAQSAWEDYSADLDADWMVLPESQEDVWRALSSWLGFIELGDNE